MNKFKTVQTNNKIVSFEGQLRLLSEKDGWLQRVEVRLLNSDVNRNNWKYVNLDEHRKLFARTPLLCAYVGDKIADGHNFKMRKDENGREVPDFTAPDAERIVGYFAKDEDIRIELIDGKKWIVGVGTIFTWYNRQLVEKLKERGSLSVSIETLIDEMHYENDTEVFTKYQILGTTILNEKVNPAVVGANIKTLQFKGDIQEFTMRVASYDEQQSGLPKKESQSQNKNQNSRKGVTRTMAKVRKLDDLRSMFPNYTVLGAKGQSVALLNEKGRCCSYTFLESEDTVVPERIEEIAVNSVFGEGENAIDISAEELVGSVQAQLNSTKTALDKATEENTELKAKINAMTEAEYLRRKKVVQNAIKSCLDENRAQYGADIDEHLCDDMYTDENLSNYAKMEDKDGFCGENAVRTEVDARCMRKLREISKEMKARKNAHFDLGHFVMGDEGKPESGINSAIENILKD